jgi:hypothetical protein
MKNKSHHYKPLLTLYLHLQMWIVYVTENCFTLMETSCVFLTQVPHTCIYPETQKLINIHIT